MHSDEYDTDASTDASDSGGDDDDDVIDDDVNGEAAAAGAGSSGNGVRQHRSDRGSTSVTVGRCRLNPVEYPVDPNTARHVIQRLTEMKETARHVIVRLTDTARHVIQRLTNIARHVIQRMMLPATSYNAS